MEIDLTRRELLRYGGMSAIATTTGCLGERVTKARRDISQAPRHVVDPAAGSAPVTVESRLSGKIDLSTSQRYIGDCIPTATGGVLLAGQADGDPVLVRLSADGDVTWTRTLTLDDEAGFRSLTRTSAGDLVAAGFTGWNGLVAKVTPSGDVVWTRTLTPGPADYELTSVCPLEDGSVLAVGARMGPARPTFSDRSSAWLVRITAAGAVDWHRFYGTEIWGVNDVVVRGPDTYLLAVWKQTGDDVDSYESIVGVTNGIRAWEHVYPGASIDSLQMADQRWYHFSATTKDVSPVPLPESVLLVGRRRAGGTADRLKKLRLEGTKLTKSVTWSVPDGLLTVCTTGESSLVGILTDRDGTVRTSGVVTNAAVDRVYPVSAGVVLLVHDDVVDVVEVRPKT